MKTLSYTNLQQKYSGKFIAESNGKVVASALTYKSLANNVSKKHLKREKLTFAYIHPKGALCVYNFSSH